MAAYSLLILQVVVLLQALLQTSVSGSKHCLLVLGAAAASERTFAAKVLIFAGSYDALFVTVEPCLGRCCGGETALLAW